MFAVVDAKMLHKLNLEVFAGKQPEEPFQTGNKHFDFT